MNQKGQSLIEIILAMALSAILLPALFTGLIASRQGKVQQSQRTQAVYLLNETIDAVRSVREKGWINFANDGTFHPAVHSGNSFWSLDAGSDTVGDFTRKVDISDVQRNPAAVGPIVASGGTLDPSSKKVVVTISWTLPYSSSVTGTLYMTRYLENFGHVDTLGLQTPLADFDLGTTTSTAITNVSGGEVVLGAGGGGGDWCQPTKFTPTAQDLPKSGVANAVTAIEDSSGNAVVFAGTGDNSSGISFAKVSITGDPPTISSSISATFDGYKTNAVFGETNFAYLATDNNSKEIVIMSLTQYSDPPTNSKYKEVGSINLSGNVNGNSIYVTNNKAFVLSSDSKFYIYNLSADRTSATLQNSGGRTISGAGKKVLVDGNYAYVATAATSNQFQIICFDSSCNSSASLSNPIIVGQLTLGTSQTGVDAYVNTSLSNPDRAYFVTSYSSGKKNFFVIDISSKTNPKLPTGYIGYDTNGMSPKGLTVVTGNRAIVVGTGGTLQYQVINLNDELHPIACGPGLSYATGVNGVASVLKTTGPGTGYAYSYIITGDTAAELKIILGGAGAGSSYVSAGNFVSQAVDAGATTVFNRFDVTASPPSGTTSIGFQVAVANAVSGSCLAAAYTFLGPALTSAPADLYTTGSPIPILNSGNYQNPGRCFKYKAYLSTTNSNNSPLLYDFTVNYSP